jgi:thioredoxin-related protein
MSIFDIESALDIFEKDGQYLVMIEAKRGCHSCEAIKSSLTNGLSSNFFAN